MRSKTASDRPCLKNPRRMSLITEIGGTTGDIEGLPFLEAIREFALEVGYNNAIFLHVTYVPFIKAAGELKTKPTQQSVAKLREIGIAPHIIACRCEKPLDKELRQKISLFCNVPVEAVIEAKDVDHSIYEMPLMLQRERPWTTLLSAACCTSPHARAQHGAPGGKSSANSSRRQHRRARRDGRRQIHRTPAGRLQNRSRHEAIIHGGIGNDCGVEIVQVNAEEIEKRYGAGKNVERPRRHSGARAASANAGIEGKILAARYARENKIPYLGLCLPACRSPRSEFARNVLKLDKADSTEFDRRNATCRSSPCSTPRKKSPRKAAPCVSAPFRRAIASCSTKSARKAGQQLYGSVRHQRTPPAPLRIQQRLPRKIREGRFHFLRHFAGRQVGGSDRAERSSFFSGEPVPPGIFEQAAPAASAVQGLHRRRAPAHPPQAAVS